MKDVDHEFILQETSISTEHCNAQAETEIGQFCDRCYTPVNKYKIQINYVPHALERIHNHAAFVEYSVIIN